MSVGYTSVQWNSFKKRYDVVLAASVILILASFAGVGLATNPSITVETVLIRGTALSAFVLLNLILCIGPLARLDRRFLPLLYNRRHLGVAMFALAFVHAALATMQFHGFGDKNPLVSLFTAYKMDFDPFIRQSANISHFPFEPLGAAALVILFLMAATSHDFWLKQLGASWWKTLHLLVLAAYGLIVLHVTYGALQSETNPIYPLLLGTAMFTVFGLHLTAARRERSADRERTQTESEGFIRACHIDELSKGRGHAVWLGGRRVAVFLHLGRVWATANVCRHQGGPLGEGRIIDGCITCPWHGWQYRPDNGTGPPPFEEKIETFRTRLIDGAVFVHPEPSAPGTPQPGTPVKESDHV